ncbi:hypothetical protein WBP07_02640 [Novosphingobium sp. BL-8A]|uniref:hypothetical protein n=1 Tax=Novosphingobium sp. BL-8A TaxID=3127639 RepID=UPI003757C1BF
MVQWISSNFRCLFNRHEPVHDDVTWDGAHYISNCHRCGSGVRRESQGVWRRDWLQL